MQRLAGSCLVVRASLLLVVVMILYNTVDVDALSMVQIFAALIDLVVGALSHQLLLDSRLILRFVTMLHEVRLGRLCHALHVFKGDSVGISARVEIV